MSKTCIRAAVYPIALFLFAGAIRYDVWSCKMAFSGSIFLIVFVSIRFLEFADKLVVQNLLEIVQYLIKKYERI